MSHRNAHRYRPSLEPLETRIVPQATRTWVSGVGDDVNPCSRTAPCKTFAGAISKTEVGGEIDALDPGGFGPVTIVHSITIDGGGQLAGVLTTVGNGITIRADPDSVVVLRGLTINGSGTALHGIRVTGAAAVYVENCIIQHFAGFGIDYEPAGAGQLFVTGSVIHNNTGGGIFIHPGPAGARATLGGDQVEGNGFGIRADDGARVTVFNSTVAGNANEGVFANAVSAPTDINLVNVVVANNGTDIRTQGTRATVRLAGVLFGPGGTQASTAFLSVVRTGRRRATLTAQISGDLGPVTGTVLFLDGNRLLGSVRLVDGSATLMVRLARGRHHLRVMYLGDDIYAESQSAAVRFVAR